MVRSDLRAEVEIWPFCACAMHLPIHVSAGASLSEPPRTRISPNFLRPFQSSVITLQHLHLCEPLYLAFPQCDPSFPPTYKAFHYHIGPFHAVKGPFTPVPPCPGREVQGVCAGSDQDGNIDSSVDLVVAKAPSVRYVFSSRQKMVSEGAAGTSTGRLFQTCEVTTGNSHSKSWVQNPLESELP